MKTTNKEDPKKSSTIKLKAKSKDEAHDWVKKLKSRIKEFSNSNSDNFCQLDCENNSMMMAEFMMAEDQKSQFLNSINDQVRMTQFEAMLDSR